jgi:hypothetical protein
MTSSPPTSGRPGRPVLLGGLVGAFLAAAGTAAVLVSKTRLWSSSSTAPIGLVTVVPALAALWAAPGAIVGASLAYLSSGWSNGRRLRERGMAVAGLLLVAVAGWAAWQAVPELFVGRKVRAVEQMSEPELGQVLDDRTYGHNRFVLAAVAGNPGASSGTLDRITQRPEADLHTGLGSVFDDVQGKNTRGTAVMRLVVENPNVRPESIERLARSSESPTVAFVAGSPKLSEATVRRLASSPDWTVLHGVAWNQNAPPDVLERLSMRAEAYIRLAVAQNRNTPPEVLHRLQSDPDDLVRRAALRAIPAPPDNILLRSR